MTLKYLIIFFTALSLFSSPSYSKERVSNQKKENINSYSKTLIEGERFLALMVAYKDLCKLGVKSKYNIPDLYKIHTREDHLDTKCEEEDLIKMTSKIKMLRITEDDDSYGIFFNFYTVKYDNNIVANFISQVIQGHIEYRISKDTFNIITRYMGSK